MCLAIHALVPEPEITGVSPKLRYFKAHEDKFDTVFIGTSRVYYQIAPEIFDRAMAEHGTPTRSFNLGVAGMAPPESFLLLERFLALRPAKLKWVFIEFEPVQANWDPARRSTHRLLYWHNWRLTSIALRKAIDPRGTARSRKMLSRIWQARETVALHLKLFAQNMANVGAVTDFNDLFAAARHPDEGVHELGPRRDGYRPAGGPMPPDKIAEYTSALAEAAGEGKPKLMDPYAEHEYREVARSIRALGAVPVFLVAPLLQQAPFRFGEAAAAPGAVIEFNDARRYPEFYNPGVRFDKGHLSRQGAEIFSQVFAERFISELQAGEIR